MTAAHGGNAAGWEEFTQDEALRKCLQFLETVDALKGVSRMSSIVGGARRENSAEHSWHVALMAMVLAPYANETIDVGRVIRMMLVHDLVEIDAGDTYCYDDVGNADKAARETLAAKRIYGLLPEAAGIEARALWDEFEARKTPESKFANAIDRLQPILLNLTNNGKLWTDNDITADKIRSRNGHVAEGSEELWQLIDSIINHAEDAHWLASQPENRD